MDLLHVPFSFQVPQPGHGECYPPSLGIGTRYFRANSSSARTSACVAYEVAACIFDAQRVVSLRVAEIRAINAVSAMPPPIALDDFAGDYICTVSGVMRNGKVKNWWSGKTHHDHFDKKITITVLEPKVLQLRPETHHGDSKGVDVTATVDLTLLNVMPGKIETPGDLEVIMTWTLETHTFIAVARMEHIPSLAEVSEDPFLGRRSTNTPPRTAKLVLRDWVSTSQMQNGAIPVDQACSWSRAQDNDLAYKNLESHWHTSEHLRLTLGQISVFSTTFYTPFLARRHNLRLEMKCRSSESTTSTFSFRIPIQIALARQGSVDGQDSGLPEQRRNEIVHDESRDATDVSSQCPVYSR